MTALRALVAGATGLVGNALLEQLLADPEYGEVRILVRRPGEENAVDCTEIQVDYAQLDASAAAFDDVDHVYCALGTTLRKAGSRAAFRRVDFDYVAQVAQLAAAAGAGKFMLVSSLGADPQSGNFYLRTKGEAETALANLPFEAVHIVRPSLLTGPRREFRLGERLAIPALSLIAPLMRGGLRRYRPSPANAVAATLVAAAGSSLTGVNIHHLE